MINEFVEKLREKSALFSRSDFAVAGIAKDYKEAAYIIEELSAKLASAKERDEQYYKDVPDTNVGKWIPVSEKLPEEKFCDDGYVEPSDTVLVFTKYGSCKVSRYWGNRRNKRDYYDWVDIDYRKKEVLAWQPLPDPYKGE
jgi:hypothetical protein